ncbi:hypothetical protein GF373_02865, partial [bacterium]|nr:hypothetical protein [bacterium]
MINSSLIQTRWGIDPLNIEEWYTINLTNQTVLKEDGLMQYVRISLVYLVLGVCALGMAGTVYGYGVREAEESLRDHRYQ